MLFDFYYKTIKPVSMVLFYILIGLLIAILAVNNNLLDSANKKDDKKFQETLKTQKGLIWANFSIMIIFFLYLLIISFYLFTSRFQAVYNRRENMIIRRILLFSLIILSSGLTYYVDKIINEMTIFNAKEELKKIYIIVPLMSIIALCLLMYDFSKVDSALTYMNHYFNEHQYDEVSVTRTSSPTRSNVSEDEDDVPEYFRENLPNRRSPYFEDNDY